MPDKQEPISLKFNPNKFTIELSEIHKIMPDIEIGAYVELGSVYLPSKEQWVNARLLVVPDGGYEN